jgi:hypothetical protein
MIVLVVAGGFTYTHRQVHRLMGRVRFRTMTYDRLFRGPTLPRATYIFTDFDRLSAWDLELAAQTYRALGAAGLRVLNDPARVLERFALLRRLHQAGVNAHAVWRPADGETPDRFPVFLRTASGHRGVMSELLHSHAEVETETERLLATGVPLREVMVVEYCAEPQAPDFFVRFAAYRIGDTFVPAVWVTDRVWSVKMGRHGIATLEQFEKEREYVESGPYRETLWKAFEIASVEYGRVDFGVVGGRPEIYEINTNPHVKIRKRQRVPYRLGTVRIADGNYREAMAALDTTATGSVPISIPGLKPYRRWLNYFRAARRTL